MWIALIRGLLLAGMAAATVAYAPLPFGRIVNLAVGLAIGGAVIFLETRIRTDNPFFIIAPLDRPVSAHAAALRDWLIEEIGDGKIRLTPAGLAKVEEKKKSADLS